VFGPCGVGGRCVNMTVGH